MNVEHSQNKLKSPNHKNEHNSFVPERILKIKKPVDRESKYPFFILSDIFFVRLTYLELFLENGFFENFTK